MESKHSKSANMTSCGSEGFKGLIDEMGSTRGATAGGGWRSVISYVNVGCAIGLPLGLFMGYRLCRLMGYQLDLEVNGIWAGMICGTALPTAIFLLATYLTKWNGQVKNHISAETTNSATNETSQANKPTCREHRQKFDVFLSHSGKQKNFVRQLHRDLTNAGVSCFFDEDRQSLPVCEDFPDHIFEAANTCKVGVFLLSEEFLESKWPMLEASTFVKARDTTNPNLQILPLFFIIPPEALKKIRTDNEKWKGFEKSDIIRAEWKKALDAMRRINGLKFSEDGNEVTFRDQIVAEVSGRLPKTTSKVSSPLYARRRKNVSSENSSLPPFVQLLSFAFVIHPSLYLLQEVV